MMMISKRATKMAEREVTRKFIERKRSTYSYYTYCVWLLRLIVQQVPLIFKVLENSIGIFLCRGTVSFEGDLRVDRRFVWIIYTGESHGLAFLHCLTCLGIQTFHIALFTDFDRC